MDFETNTEDNNMVTSRFFLVAALFCVGCPSEPEKRKSSESGAFDQNATVRIDAPTMGESVESPFSVQYSLGPDVDGFALFVGDAEIDGLSVDQNGSGSIEVEAAAGRHRIALDGYDEAGTLLNEHWIEVNVVAPDEPWVTITTPSSGAVVGNPVQFGVSASEHIDEVELLADDWSLGVVAPGELLSYRFEGTEYERAISAQGYGDGEMLATDSISITVRAEEPVTASDWNQVMLDIMETYPTDGTYTYDWSDAGHGTTMDIFYDGERVASAGPGSTSFCCGVTFELYLRAFAQIDEEVGGDGLLNGMTVDDVLDFRRDWFVRDLWGDGPGIALDNYGLGEPVSDWDEILPGDPLQFWRFNGSGHSVIFVTWATDTDGTIVGVDYWSTQPSTDGIGFQREYFGVSGSDIDPAHFYASRAWMPDAWLPW